MNIIYYLSSLIISIFVLIMTIVLEFAKSESNLVKFYGEKEIYICIIISIILIILGLMSDKRNSN